MKLSRSRNVGGAIVAAALAVVLAGCEQEGPAERAGERIDESVEETTQAIEETAERAGERVEQTGEAIREETQQ